MKDIEMQYKIPTVFISYSWSSSDHKEWVLRLASRLVEQSGIEVILDVWHLKPGHDRFYFMEESVKNADKVLVICDKKYVEKANTRGGGVGTETQIITPEIYRDTKQEKFIPIALEYDKEDYLLPNYFKSRFAIGMTNLKDIEETYSELEMLIWGVQSIKPPKRGGVPSFVINETSTYVTVEQKEGQEVLEEIQGESLNSSIKSAFPYIHKSNPK
ncbi:toll/interleukin-1 receptor domain-containing protein [Priestia megaterium]|uniref:toll/interleukin-1 receptor domain-containing protein n=1 Tax=Priestia megaterium TaxID=1404 RepID=UPI001E44F3F9|nr:toll/interleukin-1 receptor domain-containing protein [Priestia megaterium]